LLGRSSSGTGVAEQITVGSGLSLSAGTLSSTAGGSFAGGTLTSNLTVAAGTTSLSPLTFQSGTNLSAEAAGAVEYDGKVIYSTPSGRGVSPSMMYYRLQSSYAGSNVSTAQSAFGVSVTLVGSTVYAFESNVILRKTSGATSHTLTVGFGGAATLNNIFFNAVFHQFTANNTTDSGSTKYFAFSTVATSATLGTSSSSAAQTRHYKVSGTVSINAGGTFTPQYTLSSAPGAAYSTLAGSSFAIWPIGAAGANTSVGSWS
jgi:hypothetical protein